MRWLFISLCFFPLSLEAKEPAEKKPICFQEVVVVHAGKIHAFRREGRELFGNWFEVTPIPWAEVEYFVNSLIN